MLIPHTNPSVPPNEILPNFGAGNSDILQNLATRQLSVLNQINASLKGVRAMARGNQDSFARFVNSGGKLLSSALSGLSTSLTKSSTLLNKFASAINSATGLADRAADKLASDLVQGGLTKGSFSKMKKPTRQLMFANAAFENAGLGNLANKIPKRIMQSIGDTLGRATKSVNDQEESGFFGNAKRQTFNKENSDRFSKYAGKFANSLATVGKLGAGFAKAIPVVGQILTVLGTVGSVAMNIGGFLFKGIKTVIGPIMNLFSQLFAGLKNIIMNMASFLYTSIKKALMVIPAVIGVAMGGIVKKAIQEFGQRESYEGGLKAIMGGDGKASAEVLKNLKEIAKLPGIDIETALGGFNKLKAAGMATDDIYNTLRAMSNEVALAGGGAEQLSLALLGASQMLGKGKINAQDLKQMLEQMPSMAGMMRQRYGTMDPEALRGMNISPESFLKDISGQMIQGMNQGRKAADGVKNQLDNIKMYIQNFFVDIGRAIGANNIKKIFDSFGKVLEIVTPVFQRFGATVGDIFDKISQVVASNGGAINGFFERLLTIATSVIRYLVGALGNVNFEAVGNKIIDMAVNIYSVWMAVVGTIGPKITAFVNGIKERFEGMGWTEAINKGLEALNITLSWLISRFFVLWDVIAGKKKEGGLQKIGQLFTNIFNGAFETVLRMANLANGLVGQVGSIMDWLLTINFNNVFENLRVISIDIGNILLSAVTLIWEVIKNIYTLIGKMSFIKDLSEATAWTTTPRARYKAIERIMNRATGRDDGVPLEVLDLEQKIKKTKEDWANRLPTIGKQVNKPTVHPLFTGDMYVGDATGNFFNDLINTINNPTAMSTSIAEGVAQGMSASKDSIAEGTEEGSSEGTKGIKNAFDKFLSIFNKADENIRKPWENISGMGRRFADMLGTETFTSKRMNNFSGQGLLWDNADAQNARLDSKANKRAEWNYLDQIYRGYQRPDEVGIQMDGTFLSTQDAYNRRVDAFNERWGASNAQQNAGAADMAEKDAKRRNGRRGA